MSQWSLSLITDKDRQLSLYGEQRPLMIQHQSISGVSNEGDISPGGHVTMSCTFFCLFSPTIVSDRTLYILPIDKQPISYCQAGDCKSSIINTKSIINNMCQKFTVLTLAYLAVFVTITKCDDDISKPQILEILGKGKDLFSYLTQTSLHGNFSMLPFVT